MHRTKRPGARLKQKTHNSTHRRRIPKQTVSHIESLSSVSPIDNGKPGHRHSGISSRSMTFRAPNRVNRVQLQDKRRLVLPIAPIDNTDSLSLSRSTQSIPHMALPTVSRNASPSGHAHTMDASSMPSRPTQRQVFVSSKVVFAPRRPTRKRPAPGAEAIQGTQVTLPAALSVLPQVTSPTFAITSERRKQHYDLMLNLQYLHADISDTSNLPPSIVSFIEVTRYLRMLGITDADIISLAQKTPRLFKLAVDTDFRNKIEFLIQLRLTPDQVNTIVIRNPVFFLQNIHNIAVKTQFLLSLGMVPQDLAQLFCLPWSTMATRDLVSRVRWLTILGVNLNSIRQILQSSSRVFTAHPSALERALKIMTKAGFPFSILLDTIRRAPSIVDIHSHNLDSLSKLFEQLLGVSTDQIYSSFLGRWPHLIYLTPNNVYQILALLRSLGFTVDEILSLLRHQGTFLSSDIRLIAGRLDRLAAQLFIPLALPYDRREFELVANQVLTHVKPLHMEVSRSLNVIVMRSSQIVAAPVPMDRPSGAEIDMITGHYQRLLQRVLAHSSANRLQLSKAPNEKPLTTGPINPIRLFKSQIDLVLEAPVDDVRLRDHPAVDPAFSETSLGILERLCFDLVSQSSKNNRIYLNTKVKQISFLDYESIILGEMLTTDPVEKLSENLLERLPPADPSHNSHGRNIPPLESSRFKKYEFNGESVVGVDPTTGSQQAIPLNVATMGYKDMFLPLEELLHQFYPSPHSTSFPKLSSTYSRQGTFYRPITSSALLNFIQTVSPRPKNKQPQGHLVPNFDPILQIAERRNMTYNIRPITSPFTTLHSRKKVHRAYHNNSDLWTIQPQIADRFLFEHPATLTSHDYQSLRSFLSHPLSRAYDQRKMESMLRATSSPSEPGHMDTNDDGDENENTTTNGRLALHDDIEIDTDDDDALRRQKQRQQIAPLEEPFDSWVVNESYDDHVNASYPSSSFYHVYPTFDVFNPRHQSIISQLLPNNLHELNVRPCREDLEIDSPSSTIDISPDSDTEELTPSLQPGATQKPKLLYNQRRKTYERLFDANRVPTHDYLLDVHLPTPKAESSFSYFIDELQQRLEEYRLIVDRLRTVVKAQSSPADLSGDSPASIHSKKQPGHDAGAEMEFLLDSDNHRLSAVTTHDILKTSRAALRHTTNDGRVIDVAPVDSAGHLVPPRLGMFDPRPRADGNKSYPSMGSHQEVPDTQSSSVETTSMLAYLDRIDYTLNFIERHCTAPQFDLNSTDHAFVMPVLRRLLSKNRLEYHKKQTAQFTYLSDTTRAKSWMFLYDPHTNLFPKVSVFHALFSSWASISARLAGVHPFNNPHLYLLHTNEEKDKRRQELADITIISSPSSFNYLNIIPGFPHSIVIGQQCRSSTIMSASLANRIVPRLSNEILRALGYSQDPRARLWDAADRGVMPAPAPSLKEWSAAYHTAASSYSPFYVTPPQIIDGLQLKNDSVILEIDPETGRSELYLHWHDKDFFEPPKRFHMMQSSTRKAYFQNPKPAADLSDPMFRDFIPLWPQTYEQFVRCERHAHTINEALPFDLSVNHLNFYGGDSNLQFITTRSPDFVELQRQRHAERPARHIPGPSDDSDDLEERMQSLTSTTNKASQQQGKLEKSRKRQPRQIQSHTEDHDSMPQQGTSARSRTKRRTQVSEGNHGTMPSNTPIPVLYRLQFPEVYAQSIAATLMNLSSQETGEQTHLDSCQSQSSGTPDALRSSSQIDWSLLVRRNQQLERNQLQQHNLDTTHLDHHHSSNEEIHPETIVNSIDSIPITINGKTKHYKEVCWCCLMDVGTAWWHHPPNNSQEHYANRRAHHYFSSPHFSVDKALTRLSSDHPMHTIAAKSVGPDYIPHDQRLVDGYSNEHNSHVMSFASNDRWFDVTPTLGEVSNVVDSTYWKTDRCDPRALVHMQRDLRAVAHTMNRITNLSQSSADQTPSVTMPS